MDGSGRGRKDIIGELAPLKGKEGKKKKEQE